MAVAQDVSTLSELRKDLWLILFLRKLIRSSEMKQLCQAIYIHALVYLSQSYHAIQGVPSSSTHVSGMRFDLAIDSHIWKREIYIRKNPPVSESLNLPSFYHRIHLPSFPRYSCGSRNDLYTGRRSSTEPTPESNCIRHERKDFHFKFFKLNFDGFSFKCWDLREKVPPTYLCKLFILYNFLLVKIQKKRGVYIL